MTDCCDEKSCEVEALQKQHAKILRAVLAINAVMFLVEAVSGYLARSSALLGDSLDMLGDALAYGTSLYVLGKGERMNARAAMFKGGIMAVLGTAVLVQTLLKIIHPSLPAAETMGWIGSLALAANLACFALLWKNRSDDLNMHSVWLCSRNDLLGNVGVLAAALGVGLTLSSWPDIAIGVLIAVVILRSSFGVMRRAYAGIMGA